jgi:hypothetical protein
MFEESYDMAAINKMHAYERHDHFHDGHASVNDNPPSRRSSTSTNDENIEHVRNVV